MADAIGEVLERNIKLGEAGFSDAQRQQLAALTAQIGRLQASVQKIASNSKQIISSEADEMLSLAENKLKENVFLSVGIAAVIGYAWARLRH